MPLVPTAAFLAGALLSLLLPAGLLIALSLWYWVFSVRVPETAEPSKSRTTQPPTVTQNLPHDPQT